MKSFLKGLAVLLIVLSVIGVVVLGLLAELGFRWGCF